MRSKKQKVGWPLKRMDAQMPRAQELSNGLFGYFFFTMCIHALGPAGRFAIKNCPQQFFGHAAICWEQIATAELPEG